jgi:hypothetical protein
MKAPNLPNETKVVQGSNRNSYGAIDKMNGTKSIATKPSRKLELIEKTIEEQEEKIKFLEQLMEIHNSEVNRLRELFEEKEQVEQELERAYVEWEALQS